MPNYEEVIQQSQANVKSLSEKLNQLDRLHQDIKGLIRQPEIFDSMYQQIVKLSQDYMNTLGAATKQYLDGNNTLFTTKLGELSSMIEECEKEIDRLVAIDFTRLFKDLQKAVIDQTRRDLAVELKRFGEKTKHLQTEIEELTKQVDRLKTIDLEKHYGGLKGEVTKNRIILIIGLSVIVMILAYVGLKL